MILLNKADLAEEADLVALEAVVRKLNPAARVVRTVSSGVDLAEVLGTGVFDLDEASQAAGWVQVGSSHFPARLCLEFRFGCRRRRRRCCCLLKMMWV